jgi:sulfur carrier protein ThiS
MAKIRLIGYVAEIFGYREKTVKIEKPLRIEELFLFPENMEKKRLIILINGVPATLESKVTDRDELVIMQMVGGG